MVSHAAYRGKADGGGNYLCTLNQLHAKFTRLVALIGNLTHCFTTPRARLLTSATPLIRDFLLHRTSSSAKWCLHWVKLTREPLPRSLFDRA